MKVSVLHRTYNGYGGDRILSPAGLRLSLGLGNYGEAVVEIEIIANLRSATNEPLPTLGGMLAQFMQHIATLPKVAFRRKKKCMELQFLCEGITAEDISQYQRSVEKSNRAMSEVLAVLPLLGTRLKKTDDFNFSAFLDDARCILEKPFALEEEIRQTCEQAESIRLAEQAKKSWWEQEDIDWDQYHPQAREILDEPFFWDCVDDSAPHGNDTGADLLADYQRWVKRHSDASPLAFLDRLFARWGMEPIDWNMADEAEVQRLQATKPIELSVSNQAIVALAFAVLKVKGECPSDVCDLALKALQRDSYSFHEDGTTKIMDKEATAKMRAILER